MAKQDKQAEGKQLSIDLPEHIAEGVYSNLAIISHSPTEFVADFVQIIPNVPKAKVRSRVILAPQHARRLMRALQDNIAKYEAQFGTIHEPESGRTGFPPMTFNTPPAEA